MREANVYSEIVPASLPVAELLARRPKAVILSGGPSSVYEPGAPVTDPALFTAGVPVFGICYGFQAMAQALGGEVANTGGSEFGRTLLDVFREVHAAGTTVVLASHDPAVLGLATQTVRGGPYPAQAGDDLYVDGTLYGTITQVAPGGNLDTLRLDRQVPVSAALLFDGVFANFVRHVNGRGRQHRKRFVLLLIFQWCASVSKRSGMDG